MGSEIKSSESSESILQIQMGERTLISSLTLLIPKEEVCDFTLKVNKGLAHWVKDDYFFKVRVKFEDDNELKQSVSFKPDFITKNMLMTLHNWNSSLGSALKDFYPLISMEDKAFVELMLSNRRIGTTNELFLQFWMREII